MFMNPMSRPTFRNLSEAHLLHNLSVVRAAAPQSKILAMVKANAYGHGMIEVGRRLDGKVDSLGVASLDEAMQLRQAGVKSVITMIEGAFSPEEYKLAAQHDFAVVFHHPQQIQWLQQSPPSAPLTAWLKIDTGMGRLGFLPDQVRVAYAALASSPSIRQPFGLMSHFANADVVDHPLNTMQIAAFEKCAAQHQGPKSLCNSPAIFSLSAQHYDWVRPGLALYGAAPLAGTSAAALGLKPVMTLRSALISVKQMKRGHSLGYGSRIACPEDMPVGIVAIGYGDGYPRSAKDGTPVLVEGRRCAVMGRVSMDMTIVDLRGCPHAHVGGEVILWGEGLPVDEVALSTAHINYDLLTGVHERAKALWS
jgi:alanine racemase